MSFHHGEPHQEPTVKANDRSRKEELRAPPHPERREARRAEILAAARRCFARDGFHPTSMPDIAREAGLSTGAFYRYFTSKDDVVLEVAGQAFTILTGRLDEALAGDATPTVADLVTAVVGTMGAETVTLPDGSVIGLDELVRCGVQAWGEATRPGGAARPGAPRLRRPARAHRGRAAPGSGGRDGPDRPRPGGRAPTSSWR